MLLKKEKESRVKFNLGLSANRPSNNWAQDAKLPNLVLVRNLPQYSISLKLVFEAPDEALRSRSFATYLPSRQEAEMNLCAKFSKFLVLSDNRVFFILLSEIQTSKKACVALNKKLKKKSIFKQTLKKMDKQFCLWSSNALWVTGLMIN